MAVKIEEAMDMSLDDYIAMSKKSTSPQTSTNKITYKTSTNNTNDAKFGRRKSQDEEDDEEELLVSTGNEEEASASMMDTGIWKGPDSSTTYLDCNSTKNDLRQRLNNNFRKPISSVQYRLMAPNNSADRPRGIPTLLPLDAYVQKPNNGNNNYRRHYRGNNRNRNRGFNGFNNNNRFGGNDMGGMNNGRIQRNRNQDLSKNLRLTVNRNGFNDAESVTSQSTPRNMIINCPSSSINLQPSPQMKDGFQRQYNTLDDHGNRCIPIGKPTPQAQAALDLNSNMSQMMGGNGGNNDSLRSVLGFQGNVTGDMMPVFATRLMELIKSNAQAPVHKPIYDMKIQKDIHEIQNKPLLYKCPGGEVVSSDGTGVNCQIIPRTSGISLNCRFA